MSRVFGIINRHALSLEGFDWTLPETTGYDTGIYLTTKRMGSKVVDLLTRTLTWTSGRPSVPLFVLLPVLE